jgi:hypothetical protein
MSKRTRLPDLWWFRLTQPQAYVCPFLMTLTIWVERMKFWKKHKHPIAWYSATKNDIGEWREPARVIRGNCEVGCIFPRKWVIAECNFWNSRLGMRLRRPLWTGEFED